MLASFALALSVMVMAADSQPAKGVSAAAEAALATLSGNAGFAFCELTDDGPRLLHGVRQDERFAVGSSFKLFILGTLAAEVNDDRRALENIMRLRADLAGPPHSEMADWPLDSPVTLQTLSLKMISISDNTATDHLHYLLGRKRIERQMRVMIGDHAAWNIPLLNTREMTSLRNKKAGMPGKEYEQLDVAAKREFLAKLGAGLPDYEALEFDTAAYNIAEWYATPFDMAKALAWIQQHTQDGQPAHPLRGVLAMDPKLPHDPAEWPYVGFKGGSEEQLLAGNWLLQHKSGRWFSLHVFYNNPDGKADEKKMIAAIGAIFQAINKSLE